MLGLEEVVHTSRSVENRLREGPWRANVPCSGRHTPDRSDRAKVTPGANSLCIQFGSSWFFCSMSPPPIGKVFMPTDAMLMRTMIKLRVQ
jgi:hypothetical protein